jgi:pimeloyl-ACP methyl ester carboxylesterase
MGALVALEFALAFPARTRRVGALNAVFRRNEQQRAAVMDRANALGAGGRPDVDVTIERWFGNPVPAALLANAACAARLLAEIDPVGYARTYRLFATSDAVHADRLSGLVPEALFMTGELDPNSSPQMSTAMARLAPRARLDILPGARHMMTLTHPQRVNASLRSFLMGGRG